MAEAAIHNGADAIYVGFPYFNARGRTEDLSYEKLKFIIETAHLYGVKVNLALNILIFQNEFEKLIPLLAEILTLKPDALIVQDLGLAQVIRKMAPDQVLHASTQMTITNHEAISLLEDLKIKRFVMARESSLAELKNIREHTKKELEVFVHGALCVAYSGQCFTSESIGGRSANRGQCAQSCRFAYDLIVDGSPLKNEKKYVVSPQDLCGIKEIPELLKMGINSFKVEGRLKTSEYVATAAKEYRHEIDSVLKNQIPDQKSTGEAQSKMAITYSRGFFPGWLHGVNHQELVDGRFSSHRGLYLGRIIEVDERSRSMTIELEKNHHLKPGDGVLWVPEFATKNEETGAQIYHALKRKDKRWKLEFGNHIQFGRQAVGSLVYLNHDPELSKEVKATIQDREKRKRVPVRVSVILELGQNMKVEMSDGTNTVVANSHSKVDLAKTKGVVDEQIQEELSALGGTVFILGEFKIERKSDQPLFISNKEVKEVRKLLSEKLVEARISQNIDHFKTDVRTKEETLSWFSEEKVMSAKNSIPQLRILLRDRGQVEDLILALEKNEISKDLISYVFLDFEFGRDFSESVAQLKSKKIKTAIATTRILKPNEYNNLKLIQRLEPDGILVRNLGSLQYFTKVSPFAGDLFGDFSLNVTNHLSAKYLLSKGLKTLTISYDLNQTQVSDLLSAAEASCLEVTAHQYMPSFHMEHCVFAAFLSQGKSFIDCGKPCEKHELELKDQFGNFHRIKADQECRNTMFNAVPYSAIRMIPSWSQLGLGFIRYEALKERGADLISKIQAYQIFLKGTSKPEEILSSLKAIEKYGLGEGALAQQGEYISRKKS